MNRSEIANDLRRYTNAGMISAKELAAFMNKKSVWRVKQKYLTGLERVGQKYFISDVAQRLKEKCVL